MRTDDPASFCAPARIALAAALAAGAMALSGCVSYFQSSNRLLGVITPYKVEIVQGNVVTKEQASRLKVGMQRSQVRDVLGSPLLTDAFHADRWDYVFTIRRQGAPPQDRRVVLLFAGETLGSIEGADDLPAEHDFVASIDTYRTPRTPPVLELTPEQVGALPAPKVAAADVAGSAALPASAPGEQRTYPPLEPR